jgi:hypothetical protein
VTEGAIEERPSLSFHLLAFAGAFRRVDMNHEVVASELLNLRIFVTLRHKSRRYGVKVSQMKIRFHETLQTKQGKTNREFLKPRRCTGSRPILFTIDKLDAGRTLQSLKLELDGVCKQKTKNELAGVNLLKGNTAYRASVGVDATHKTVSSVKIEIILFASSPPRKSPF